MPDPALEQAIREAYASAPTDTVILHTLELRHPAFADDDGRPTAIRVVRDHVDLTARLEADARRSMRAEMVRFVALAFESGAAAGRLPRLYPRSPSPWTM